MNKTTIPALRRRALLGASLAASLPVAVRAQESYPARPVRVIVSYGAGGAVDTVARLVFMRMATRLGQSFVIENRGGAGGTIGANAVAQAKPDGYTLLDDASGFAINPSLMAKLPYDAAKDFTPVGMVVTVPNTLLLGPGCPARTVAELIELAKARPGEITCASTGTGSSQHLALELFNRMAGTEIVHVPYRDTPAAQNDLRAGRIAMIISTATSALPVHGQESLRVIAHTGQEAVAKLPGIPAVADTLPGYRSLEWHGIFAPAGTPEAIVTKLNTALRETLGEADLQERLAGLGAAPAPASPQDAARFIGQEMVALGKLIREAGISAN